MRPRRPPKKWEFIFGEICNAISLGIVLAGLVAALYMLSGCSPLWREEYPKPRREPCEVILKDDQGHYDCTSHRKLPLWACRELGQMCDYP